MPLPPITQPTLPIKLAVRLNRRSHDGMAVITLARERPARREPGQPAAQRSKELYAGLICNPTPRPVPACDTGHHLVLPMRPRAFSDEVDTGSSKKMRPNKKLERRSDSIGSECALDAFECLEKYFRAKFLRSAALRRKKTRFRASQAVDRLGTCVYSFPHSHGRR